MKKILILLVAICCLGCECKHNERKNVEINSYIPTNVGSMCYVDFDGHQYVIWYNHGHRGSMCHSPKCPCLEQYKTK